MAHCINWTEPTVNLKCLVNNCFCAPLTSRNTIFSARMLHVVPPENRRFPGDEAVSVCGLFVCPAAFLFVSPHLCFCFPCKVYVESNEHHTSFLLTAATENSTSSELTRCLRQKAKEDKRHKHMAKTWIRSDWEEKWKPIGHLQSLSYQENLTQHRNLTWQRAA